MAMLFFHFCRIQAVLLKDSSNEHFCPDQYSSDPNTGHSNTESSKYQILISPVFRSSLKSELICKVCSESAQ